MQFVETKSGQDLAYILRAIAEQPSISGILEASTTGASSTIWVRSGRPVYARSSETIGLSEALLSLGLISTLQLNKLLHSEENTHYIDYSRMNQLDKLLLENKLVSPQIITYIRAFQIAETLFSIVSWDKVVYEFKHMDNVQPNVGLLELLPTSYNWVHDVFEFSQEWPRLRHRIGLPQQVFQQQPLKRQQQILNKDEEKLYHLVDGKRQLRELVLWSGLNYVTAHRLLYHLLDKGGIDIVERERFRPSVFLSKKVTDQLQPLLKLPGVLNAFLVDRSGKMIAYDRNYRELSEKINAMALIFTQTIIDFEENLPQDSRTGTIEQILVETQNRKKKMLIVSGSIILVIEAENSANWGLLRLTGQRILIAIRMHLFAS